ncbi:probable alkaline/neutral invertase F [Rhodamnia argentea]|uniref:Alkaline/neutral invertase n=1 Tax=Rhodamnia argentea TaxID=178133 RepID=A0A8B8Q314_9MYRT|nr:probable alkaline/neutral invertase F [Rhodamnia argentea]XP_048141338.1 probable alkaline/neutral invertase F [Rhodamnia argentea]
MYESPGELLPKESESDRAAPRNSSAGTAEKSPRESVPVVGGEDVSVSQVLVPSVSPENADSLPSLPVPAAAVAMSSTSSEPQDAEAALKSSSSLGSEALDANGKSPSEFGEIEMPEQNGDSSDSAKDGDAEAMEKPSGLVEEEASPEKPSRKASFCHDASDNVKATIRPCPSLSANLNNYDSMEDAPLPANGSPVMEEAWERLNKSYVFYKGKPVGTLAAMDPNADALNYNQVFVRDFVPSGLACLMKKDMEPEIVKNFLLKTLHLQGWEKRIDNFTLGEGVMPASFKVGFDLQDKKERLVADFGGSAIGRVAPVDSGFWWIILLRSYTKCTHDYSLADLPVVQKGMKLILNLCLSDGFDTFPTLLCADGCSMIDRRMGVYGYPIEIQALFYFALRCAQQLLKPERDGKELIERIDKRIMALSFHFRKYYWMDHTQLNIIYRYKTEEYSDTAVNKFNVIPESIPDWVFDFMPLRGGYFIGNVSPARMDFRWFLVGNCIAILSSLATTAQATAIMELIEDRWEDLIGEMPLKITYPALEGHEWRIVTGCDPKNTRWSYHNGGSWPVLLWLLTAACIKTGRPQTAKRAIELVEKRLAKDGWPEYYDGRSGRYIGKQARKYQTWSISGYLIAKLMIENPANISIISFEEDKKISKPRLTRSTSF